MHKGDHNLGCGHVFPRKDGLVARCGGPGICGDCSGDAVIAARDKDPALIKISASRDESITRILSDMQDRAEHFTGIVIIGLNKDGSQYLKTSKMNDNERAAAFCLHQAYVNKCFSHDF